MKSKPVFYVNTTPPEPKDAEKYVKDQISKFKQKITNG